MTTPDFDLKPFENYITAIRTEATASRYVISVTSFLRWLRDTRGYIDLSELPLSTLSDYVMYLLERGYLPGTISAHLAGIKRYFRWLKEQKAVAVPAFYRVELPKSKRRVKDALSLEQLTHYFRVAGELEEPLRTAILLLPCSGLRSHEMVGMKLSNLRRSSFQLEDGTKKSTLCLVTTGKGDRERVVPLFDEGAEILVKYLKDWRRLHADQTYLFPGRYKGHLSTRALRDSIQKIRGAFRASWTPHTMRRTYLTILYRRGVPLVTLAKIGGHAVQVLIDHYLALDEQDVVRALQSAGARLSGGPST